MIFFIYLEKMDEIGNEKAYSNSGTEQFGTAPQKMTKGEKIAARIVVALALIFLVLFALTMLVFGWAALLSGGDTFLEFHDEKLVDEAADPLVDFYRFTCPKYYEVPEAIVAINGTLPAQLQIPEPDSFFQSPPHVLYEPNPFLTKTENFYNVFNDLCQFQKLSEPPMYQANPNITFGPEQLEFLREILDSAFERLGGFRYEEMQTANFSASDLWRILGEVRRNFGLDIGLSLTVKDSISDRKMLAISQLYYANTLPILNADQNSTEYIEYLNADFGGLYSALKMLSPLLMEGSDKQFKSEEVSVMNFYYSFAQAYLEYKRGMTGSLGFDVGNATANANVKFSESQQQTLKALRNGTTTLAYLQANYPNIYWTDYLAGLLPGRKLNPKDTKIYLMSEPSLRLFNEFMGDENALSYMYASLLINIVSHVFTKVNVGCFPFLDEQLPHTVGFIWINNMPKEKTEAEVYEVGRMVKTIVSEYKAAIQEADWATEGTKKNLIKKLKAMRVFVGWPSFYQPFEALEPNQTASIDKYHEPWFNALARIPIDKFSTNFTANDMQKNVDILDRNSAIFYRILMAIYRVKETRELDALGKKVDPEEALKPYDPNAYYTPWTNTFCIDYKWIALYFRAEQMVESYGKIGHTIAHEIGHGFDPTGMLYDDRGLITNKLLDKKSALEFDKIQECVVQLYAKECCPIVNGTASCVDGWLKMGENFADISGITIAYRAFKKRQRLLHGGHFELTKRKFWVGFSALWCDPRPSDEYFVKLMADAHSPNECRVNLAAKSVPQFAYDFGSKYALDKGERCYLWSTKAK